MEDHPDDEGPSTEHACAARVYTGLPARVWNEKKYHQSGGKKRGSNATRGQDESRRLRRKIAHPFTILPASDHANIASLTHFSSLLDRFIREARAIKLVAMQNDVYDEVDWQRYEFQLKCAKMAKRSVGLLA